MTHDELYRELSNLNIQLLPSERMHLYMQGKETDCIPYALMAPMEAFAHIYGYSLGELRSSFDARAALMQRVADEYHITGIGCGLGLRGLGEAVGSRVIYPTDGIDYIQDYILQDYQDLDRLEEFDPAKNTFLNKKLEDALRMKDKFPDMGISSGAAGPMSTAIAIRPIEKLMFDFIKDRENAERLLRFCVRASLQWIQYFYDRTGSDDIGIADPVSTTDILGYKYYLKFSKPYQKQLFDGIKKITGKAPSLHICGHTKKIWKDLADIGFTSFSLDNCEQLQEAKESIGSSMFLSGNVAPVDVMKNGSIDDVIEAVRSSIQQGSDSPKGYMLMTGCQVPIGTPKENIDAFIYAAHKYGAHAQFGKACQAAWEA